MPTCTMLKKGNSKKCCGDLKSVMIMAPGLSKRATTMGSARGSSGETHKACGRTLPRQELAFLCRFQRVDLGHMRRSATRVGSIRSILVKFLK